MIGTIILLSILQEVDESKLLPVTWIMVLPLLGPDYGNIVANEEYVL